MTMTGANVPLAKSIVAHVPLLWFLVFRFAVSSLALAALAAREPGPRLAAMSLRDGAALAAMSLLGMVGYTLLVFEGVRRTAAMDAGIITATLPVVVALLGVAVLGDRLRRNEWIAVGLAVLGLVVVQAATAQPAQATRSLTGNLLVAGAVLCEAAFVLLGKRLAPPYRAFRLALGANVVGLFVSLPLLWAGGGATWPVLTAGQWVATVWYVLSASVLCLWLWYRGLPYAPTWLAGLATTALPITAVAVSAAVLHEPFGWESAAGAALVLASIVFAARSAARS